MVTLEVLIIVLLTRMTKTMPMLLLSLRYSFSLLLDILLSQYPFVLNLPLFKPRSLKLLQPLCLSLLLLGLSLLGLNIMLDLLLLDQLVELPPHPVLPSPLLDTDDHVKVAAVFDCSLLEVQDVIEVQVDILLQGVVHVQKERLKVLSGRCIAYSAAFAARIRGQGSVFLG